jgi:hypothetical protein
VIFYPETKEGLNRLNNKIISLNSRNIHSEVEMVISPKMDSWGCATCYNHIKINGEDRCELIGRNIEYLSFCPLGRIKKKEF